MSGPTKVTQPFAETVESLVSVAIQAGADPHAARSEAEIFAAAIVESAPGAYVDWADALGKPRDAQAFFDAASKGRRWRAAPTATLNQLVLEGSVHARPYAEALAEIAAAAVALGQPTMRVAGNASVAAAAQLTVARARPIPSSWPDGRSAAEPSSPTMVAQSELAAEQPAPEPSPKTLEELLAELDALTGLKEVKAEIHRQVAVLRVEALRSEAGLKSPTITRHLVFVGNPGTGKTTVARLVGGIYRALGLLEKGQLIEVDRADLVAGYLGQTAIKTSEVIASAEGGVLFIDEAYALSRAGAESDSFGQEAIDTLVKLMEDHRDEAAVIVAGYSDEMLDFLSANPGLASRFSKTIEFENYSPDELTLIVDRMIAAHEYDLDALPSSRSY
jgi:hypothetical protein